MDTLRGTFDTGIPADENKDWDAGDEGRDGGPASGAEASETASARDLPPDAIGQDERRMQVRAYNHWASLIGEAAFPSIEELEPHNLGDFGPNSVLLDFTAGVDDPVVRFIGHQLAQECGASAQIERLSDVPPRSLLSRITDHYMQILANEAPIGFEAEFINQRGAEILYRGILLPFSSDGETIDFVYGVINWKEMADAATADELLLQIDQAIGADNVGDDDGDDDGFESDAPAYHRGADELTQWADSPLDDMDDFAAPSSDGGDADYGRAAATNAQVGPEADHEDGPENEAEDDDAYIPDFSQYGLDDADYDEGEDEDYGGADEAAYHFASLADYIEAPAKKVVDLEADQFDPEDYRVELPATAPADRSDEPVAAPVPAAFDADEDWTDPAELPQDADLFDCLASARLLAQSARASEDRTRHTLYAAIGRAYDVSLAAQSEPEAFAELIEQSGLTVQERAPMTPVVKLVFGHDYDKTRLTEYAAALSHAHRLELPRGALAGFLGEAEGGLKGVVSAERRLRREESGQPVEPEGEIRAALAKKLRALDEILLEALSAEGPEFSLVMVRRDAAGKARLIGEIADDANLIERAGRKLVG